jgi:ubiquinone/menaquinone biosynthesis C-methylase UbiE
MTNLSLTDSAKAFIAEAIAPGDRAIDATLGNGHDCLFLAQCVGAQGLVFGFDIQPQAIAASRQRLAQAGLLERVRLIEGSHANLGEQLDQTTLAAAMFNLGYLPGGEKSLTTRASSTLQALNQCAERLRPGGRMSILAYTGHPGGLTEAEAVETWIKGLPSAVWRVESIRPTSRKAAPQLTCIEYLGESEADQRLENPGHSQHSTL